MKNPISLSPAILLLMMVLASCKPIPVTPEPVVKVQIDLDWPQTRRTPEQIASLEAEVYLPLELAWSVMVDCKSSATPILAYEMLYIGCSNGRLYALDPTNGETQFSVSFAGSVAGMAAVPASGDFPGAILTTTESDGRIYAINAYNGAELWHHEDGYGYANSPPTVVDSKAYYTFMINEEEACIRSVSVEDGSILWQVQSEYYEVFGPPVLYDGIQDVFWAPSIWGTYQFDAETGEHDWYWYGYNTTPSYFYGPVGVSSADEGVKRLIVRGHDVKLATYRVPVQTHEGPSDWISELPFQQVIIGAAITENRSPNNLIVSQRQYLYGLNAQTGEILAQTPTIPNEEWQYNHRTPQPVIWGNYVFHISDSTYLVAYDLDGLSEVWRYDLDSRTFSSPIISGNAMFIATSANTVYALCSE